MEYTEAESRQGSVINKEQPGPKLPVVKRKKPNPIQMDDSIGEGEAAGKSVAPAGGNQGTPVKKNKKTEEVVGESPRMVEGKKKTRVGDVQMKKTGHKKRSIETKEEPPRPKTKAEIDIWIKELYALKGKELPKDMQ